ncbi:MAG: hypothetical protein JNK05_34985 [Myxococcales bacterium]|nr:hypothetical protein [Myxococcales bacterium]
MTTLRKYGRGLKLAARILYVELFGKPLKDSTTAPTDGQVLRYVAADDAWSPGTVSGGGSLPAGTNGGVLAHASSTWASTAAGTSGQLLRSNGASAPSWVTLAASDVGAIAAPGSPINGGLLYYAGSWLSTGAGSLRQPLLSGGGAIAPAFGADVVPLTQRIEDGVTSAVSTCATIAHDTTGGPGSDGIGARCVLRARNGSSAMTDAASIDGVLTTAAGGAEVGALDVRARSASTLVHVARFAASSIGMFATTAVNVSDAGTNTALTAFTVNRATINTAANGIAARVSFRVQDSGGALEDAVYLDGVLTNAGNGTEASAFDVHTRTGGAAARRVARVTAAGGLMLGAAVTQDPGVGGIAIPPTTGLYIESGGTLYNAVGVFGGSAMSFGSGAFNVTIAAFALTISSGGGTVVSGGFLDLAAGFRRRVTTVSNANHTVTSGQSVIDITGLSAARTVTGPAAANGTIVTITNTDGSATGANTITFAPATGTVNGAATHVAVNAAYGSCTYYCNGTNWTVIAKV